MLFSRTAAMLVVASRSHRILRRLMLYLSHVRRHLDLLGQIMLYLGHWVKRSPRETITSTAVKIGSLAVAIVRSQAGHA